nr:EOG090X084E [Scapholeberis mucronata]
MFRKRNITAAGGSSPKSFFFFDFENSKIETQEKSRLIHHYESTTSEMFTIPNHLACLSFAFHIIVIKKSLQMNEFSLWIALKCSGNTEHSSDSPQYIKHVQLCRSCNIFLQPQKNLNIARSLSAPNRYNTSMNQSLDFVWLCDNDTETHDKVFNSLLVHSYHMFRLFMGSMTSALKVSDQPEGELEQLKLRATYFFSKHLHMMPLEDADLADAFLGIQFLPMDKLSFLKVRSLVSHVEQTYSCISSSTVLYQDEIVWTGLCQGDVQLVYNYLTTKLFPASTNANSENRYLTGPTDLQSSLTDLRIPHVFLNHGQSTPDECQLIVYRVTGVTICLFVPATVELDHEFFVSLDATLGPRMVALSADIAEQAVLRKTPSLNIGTDSIRFLYFNQWNMAFKSTLHQSLSGHRRVLQCQTSASHDIIKTCADLSEDFSSFGDGEIVVKTKSDAWVLGKLSNHRHLYVVVTRKNAELVEICGNLRLRYGYSKEFS